MHLNVLRPLTTTYSVRQLDTSTDCYMEFQVNSPQDVGRLTLLDSQPNSNHILTQVQRLVWTVLMIASY